MHKQDFYRLFQEDDAQDLVEYCLIFACVGLLAIASTNGVAANVVQMLTTIATRFTSNI